MSRRFNAQEITRIVEREGYAIASQLGHAAVHPAVATGIRDPEPQLDAGQKPLDPDENEAGGRPSLRVRITRLGARLLDKDNLYGGAKPLCDALRYQGLIPQDDPESIDLIVRQRIAKKKDRGTEITIERI